ncbi:hypothetical protein [Ramlibacter algicola]|jgi:ElaB/YqjD/DUF883 family membrane-anchored ribosome-binding protein|uniref:DUF883 domain-containing protein n=1 Tax=Ramlibacter algicola TaxID=2795217 RepID=A0A934USM0_9BURK|nr:hypothetical protein [Ramlibacter algicola]MBK0394031.1 hypothetical protein [Ramlibacter algicola]
MNSETSNQNPFPTSASQGGGADSGKVQRVAQKAHEAIDRLQESIGTGSDKMMGWQQEYGDMAREQVRASPIAALGVAFAVGIVFSKLFMR